LNLITTALGRNLYDHISHLKTAHDVWLKLCNTYEGSSEIKSSRKDTYNRQYQTFSQKPGESLDDCFASFESIVSNLRACGPLAYTDDECAKQLLYALDDHVWGIKITTLEESTDFATVDTEKLFNKLKSHELSRKYHPNHGASLTSKALIISARVGGHNANPTNIISPSLEFALSSLAAAFDEQYESIPDDEITLLARNFGRCTSFGRRGEEAPETPGVVSSVATPPTSSPTALRVRSMTTPTRTTITKRMTTRRIASRTTRRRTSRRSCPEHVQP
jgi:hypothetical protein